MKVIELLRLPQNMVSLAKWEISLSAIFQKVILKLEISLQSIKKIHADFCILSFLRQIGKGSNKMSFHILNFMDQAAEKDTMTYLRAQTDTFTSYAFYSL